MDPGHAESSKTSIGEVVTTSCVRCRRRKIKCDRLQPCSRCSKAGAECIQAGTGEKQRPLSRTYVQALENQVASLEVFIKRLAIADTTQREDMLVGFSSGAEDCVTKNISTTPQSHTEKSPTDLDPSEATLTRSYGGQLRKRVSTNSAYFYGGTSLFHIHVSGEPSAPMMGNISETSHSPSSSKNGQFGDGTSIPGMLPFSPHDAICQRLMANFFKQQYSYNMFIYREYFLRDYDCGTGRYYSECLLYSICAMGALTMTDPSERALSDSFAARAQGLLYESLDQPDLTVLQALLLLGYYDIGHCRSSKGWLFCGMAFRLAHEMGLHLDPNNWDASAETDVDREVLRRVYWATFIADKNLSLYFGRPPALYPHEADVRNTVRIPYPQDWESLLDIYIAPGSSATAYEDGIALVGALIYRAELAKIQHRIITDLFENRGPGSHNLAIATTVQQIHTSLTKWLSGLPGKLYWNQWTVGHVPACVLHLHMQFHTSMIILHRPPRHLLLKPDVSTSEDIEICYESLQAILRLMRSFSRLYNYHELPLDFVHTLSVAASTILMRRWLDKEAGQMTREMGLVLGALAAVKEVWPCAEEIEKSVCKVVEDDTSHTQEYLPELDMVVGIGFMTGLAGPTDNVTWSTLDYHNTEGPVLTDQDLGGFKDECGQFLTQDLNPHLP